MNLLLIYPMFAMVLLTFIVGGITFATRVRAAKSGQLDPRYFNTFSVGTPTEAVLKTGRHFVNLFEMPLLFYVGLVVAMILPIVGPWILAWAWLFVVARVFHAYVHIGQNKLYPRIAAFFAGCFAVLLIWLDILITVTAR